MGQNSKIAAVPAQERQQQEIERQQRLIDVRMVAASLVVQLPRDSQQEGNDVLDYARLLFNQIFKT